MTNILFSFDYVIHALLAQSSVHFALHKPKDRSRSRSRIVFMQHGR
jgi:hypothetical protein